MANSQQQVRGSTRHIVRRLVRLFAIFLVPYVLIVMVIAFLQRSMLYFPSHDEPDTMLAPWLDDDRVIGYCREVPDAETIWLMAHGNAGQAADRDYVLDRMSMRDSLYVLEYPGYGSREGKPGLEPFNEAAASAYRKLREQYPETPVCVLGESIGSGPACSLATEQTPPDKIVLVVPFDTLANVAAKRFFFLPVRQFLLDDWDNIRSLQDFAGPVDIFAARADNIIPISHAENLANEIPGAQLFPISGGHNDWSRNRQVKIQR